MNNLKKVFVLVLIVAVVSLGLVGCKDKDKSEHPTKEAVAEEAEAVEAKAEEAATEEHPAGEHPSGEHPK